MYRYVDLFYLKHVTLILRDCHRLQRQEQVSFKLAMLVCQCLHSLMPQYLSDYILHVTTSSQPCLQLSSSFVLLRCDFSRSVSVDRCFYEKVGDRFGFGIYTCAPSIVWVA